MKKEIKEGNRKKRKSCTPHILEMLVADTQSNIPWPFSFSLICLFACLCRAKNEWFSIFTHLLLFHVMYNVL
jgi:hypothetical protein